MKCPYCTSMRTHVLDSRESDSKAATRRRRECKKCKKRFTTYERVEMLDIFVIKKDGRKEPFSYEKLFKGIMASCEKRPVTTQQIESLVDGIEKDLLRKEKAEISTSDLGEMVMNRLKKIDKVAYIRFASVYHQFEDVSEFSKEIKGLKK